MTSAWFPSRLTHTQRERGQDGRESRGQKTSECCRTGEETAHEKQKTSKEQNF